MFLNYINNFRGLAILFVVFGHCTFAIRDTFDWQDHKLLLIFLSVTISNGTVLFIFIAGFLFQYLSDRYTFTNYLRKRFLNILLPYLIVSVPAIALRVSGLPGIENRFAGHPVPLQVVFHYLAGSHLIPLWFMPMIAMFYLVSAGLVALDRDERFYRLLPLFFLISSIVPRYIENIPQTFVHFFSVYVFGMFCSRYRTAVLRFVERHLVVGVMLYVSLIVIDIYASYSQQEWQSYIGFLNLWSKLLLCCLAMYLLHAYDEIVGKRFDFLAKTSFGIFFLHGYFISVYARLLPWGNPSTPALTLVYFGFSTAVLLSSVVPLLVAKRLLGQNSRYVIGY